MIAIETKYLGPTATKGSRIKAYTCNGHSATIEYNYSLSNEKLHFESVKALKEKYDLDWDVSEMTYGGTDQGYVFTFPESTIS